MKAKTSFILAVNLLLSLIVVTQQSCKKEETTTGIFTDPRDGQTYETVVIGSQTWMAENLAYIPEVFPPDEDGGIWVNDYFGSYVGTAEKTNNYNKYGCLYNWKTAMNSCPDGWHLPSDDEWKQLEMYLGTMSQKEADQKGWRGFDEEGKHLKSKDGWSNEGNGDDTWGFRALPGGHRYSSGSFHSIGGYSDFWTATEGSDTTAWGRGLSTGYSGVYRSDEDKKSGSYVRCIKD